MAFGGSIPASQAVQAVVIAKWPPVDQPIIATLLGSSLTPYPLAISGNFVCTQTSASLTSVIGPSIRFTSGQSLWSILTGRIPLSRRYWIWAGRMAFLESVMKPPPCMTKA